MTAASNGGKLSLGQRLGFAVGGAALGVAGVPVNSLLLYFLTDTVGIAAATAGLMVGLPKLWDVVIDPWLGGFVDRLAQRAGRRAPIQAVSALLYFGSMYCVFSMSAPGWPTVLAGIVLLMLFSTAYTGFGVSELALADDMTTDGPDRTALFAVTAAVGLVLTLLATAAAPLLVQFGGGGPAGYRLMAGVLSVVAVSGLALFLASTRRYPVRQRVAEAHQPIFVLLRATAANRPFYLLMGFLMCFGVTGGVLGSLLPFANRYVLHGDATSLAGLGVIPLVTTLLALPLAVMVARRRGTRTAFQISNALVALSLFGLYFASFGPLWITWVLVGVFGLGNGGLGVLLQTTVIDLAKLPLPGKVQVSMGVYLGVLVAATKLGQSFGGAAAGFLLDAIGFVPNQAAQAPATTAFLRAAYTLVPFALMFLAAWFLWRSGDKFARPQAAQGQS